VSRSSAWPYATLLTLPLTTLIIPTFTPTPVPPVARIRRSFSVLTSVLMPIIALLIVLTSPGCSRMCILLIAKNWCQAPIGPPLFPDLIILLCACSLLVHSLEARVRLFGLPRKQRGVVTVGLPDDVSQEICVWFRRTRFRSSTR
jgi:hypothetical protein